ncbi:hypothetical protein ACLOJK_017874 [Asimina triloba]
MLSISLLQAVAMAASELACSYACLLLHDDGIPITADKISTVVNAAGVPVESYWPGIFSKLVQKMRVDDLITNVGSDGVLIRLIWHGCLEGGGGAPVAVSASASASASGAGAAPAVEEEKEEPKEESDDDMGFSLFD